MNTSTPGESREGVAVTMRLARLGDTGPARALAARITSVIDVPESLPQCVVRCPTDAVLNAAERSPEGDGVAVIDLIDRVTDWDWQMRHGRVPA